MQHSAKPTAVQRPSHAPRKVLLPGLILCVQLVATIFFLIDSIDEARRQPEGLLSMDFAAEAFIALAMLGGLFLGYRFVVQLVRDLRWNAQALAAARGALAEHVTRRFREWGLTPSEGEVALFALKGFDVGEIARLRQSATGTVRSQLSQIYAKAGVTSQARLVSLFIDDLLEASDVLA